MLKEVFSNSRTLMPRFGSVLWRSQILTVRAVNRNPVSILVSTIQLAGPIGSTAIVHSTIRSVL